MLTLFFVFLGLHSPLHAQLRLAPVQGQFEVRGEFDYWTTGANFPVSGGASQGIPYGGHLQTMSGLGEFSYDISSQARAWVGVDGGQTTATVINQTTSIPGLSIATQNNTTSGLNEGYAGGQWWLYLGDFSIVPEVTVAFPFWRVNENSTTPLLGDGAIRIQGGTWAMVQLRDFTPFVYGGYAYRDSGEAGLLVYSAGLRYSHQNFFWAQAEFDGQETLNSDINAGNRLQRDAYLYAADGGSYEFYSLNPSRGKVAALIGFDFDNFGIYGGLNTSVYGRSSADGWGAKVGMTYSGSFFGPRRRANPDAGFVEKSEKFDEKIFREARPIVPSPNDDGAADDLPPVAPSQTVRPQDNPPTNPPVNPPAKRVRKRNKPPPKEQPMPDVEGLMKDTQKSLEQ